MMTSYRLQKLILISIFFCSVNAMEQGSFSESCPKRSLPIVCSWIFPELAVEQAEDSSVLVKEMETCFVRHTDLTSSLHLYDQLQKHLVHVKWQHKNERGWLLVYARAGSVPCFYRALDLELQEVEDKARGNKISDQEMQLVCKHVIEFFIRVKADLEFHKHKTQEDKFSIYTQIRREFFSPFVAPMMRHCFKAFLQRHSKNKILFDECVNLAIKQFEKDGMSPDLSDWVCYYETTSGKDMIFRSTEGVVAPVVVPDDAILYKEIIGVIVCDLKTSYQSMYRFLNDQSEGIVTPPVEQREQHFI